MTDKGILFVFSGPSGCGKGTILNKYFSEYDDKNVTYSISATTRASRDGEIDGVNYYFVTHEEFDKMISDNDLLEWTSYCDNKYGTPRKRVMDTLEKGIDVLLEIETEGAMNVKRIYPEAVLIFVLPPSVGELRNRLVLRATEEESVINKRVDEAIREIKLADKYDYIILNDNLEEAVDSFRFILNSERLKANNNKNTISEVLKK